MNDQNRKHQTIKERMERTRQIEKKRAGMSTEARRAREQELVMEREEEVVSWNQTWVYLHETQTCGRPACFAWQTGLLAAIEFPFGSHPSTWLSFSWYGGISSYLNRFLRGCGLRHVSVTNISRKTLGESTVLKAITADMWLHCQRDVTNGFLFSRLIVDQLIDYDFVARRMPLA